MPYDAMPCHAMICSAEPYRALLRRYSLLTLLTLPIQHSPTHLPRSHRADLGLDALEERRYPSVTDPGLCGHRYRGHVGAGQRYLQRQNLGWHLVVSDQRRLMRVGHSRVPECMPG